MNDLISKLGIDWKLLTAQIVNFLILLLILRKFAYKPVLDMLHKRRNIISRSIEEAKKTEEDARRMEEAKEQEMRQVKIKAREILDSAIGAGEGQKTKILEKAKTDGEKMIAEAKNIIRAQKEQTAKDLEKETGGLALEIMEKYFKSGIKKEEQEKIIKNIIAEI
jgi:F-type H+-transporting ATPase subunit b